ncbi:MAG: Hpt domain-containing protein [Phycisphaerae bacterium]|nr:Hpt domain-containing protein [Phycisphaerae bacterium]
MSTPKSGADPIFSQFAQDPEMREIVGLFINEMPTRIAAMRSAWEGQRLEELRRLAHQLKGAGGGYGFPDLGSAAGGLESTLSAVSDGVLGPQLASLRAQFAELLSLCERVRSS